MTDPVEKKSSTKEKNDIVKDPEIMGGSARIKGTRIRVSDIAVDYEYRDWSPEEIADQYPTISLSDVYAALEYHHRNKKES
ncbi:MAG: DUF433 domain-containing protein [Candidatus Thermoplasmatota archaeon]|nr:DUF433 domain-containing protein [Candidatus Thermoplasmatota archaeon]